ncbi:MAG: extracellular solute-binding protein [Nocardioidaceae bacterium]
MRIAKIAPAVGVVVLASVLAACGGGDGGGSGGSSSGAVVFASAGGAGLDAQTEAWLEPWSEKTGKEFATNPNFDASKIKVMVDSGNVTWDVAITDGPTARQTCGKYLDKLDMSNFDTSGFTDAAKAAVTPCSVPVQRTAQVLAWNRDTVKKSLTSWADFFNPDIPGKRAVPAVAPQFLGPMEIAMVAAGKPAYPIDFDVVKEQFDKIKKDIVYFQTAAQLQQYLQAGTVDMAMALTTRLAGAEASTSDFKFDFTFQNAWTYFDQLAVIKDAPHAEDAESLLSYVVSPESQKKYVSIYPVISVLADVTGEDADASITKYRVSPKKLEELDAINRDDQWWTDNLDKGLAFWTEYTTS